MRAEGRTFDSDELHLGDERLGPLPFPFLRSLAAEGETRCLQLRGRITRPVIRHRVWPEASTPCRNGTFTPVTLSNVHPPVPEGEYPRKIRSGGMRPHEQAERG